MKKEQKVTNIKLLNIREVSEVLGVSLPTVNRLLKCKALKIVNIGRAVRISEQVLLDFIDKGGERHI